MFQLDLTRRKTMALCCLATLSCAVMGARHNHIQGKKITEPIPIQGGLGSFFPLEAPPKLTEFQAGNIVNFTFSTPRKDLRGAPVPDQAVVSVGAGIKGTRDVAMSYDTSTYSSQFSNHVGGSLGFHFISAGASYSDFVADVSSSTNAAYQSATSLTVSVQTVRITQPTRVRFIPEVEAALDDLNAAFTKNATGSTAAFYEFFHNYNAYFVSEYTYGGFADFSVTSTSSSSERLAAQADQYGASVGLAFAGIGLSMNTQHGVSSEQYNEMMQASTKINVNCQGGEVALCAQVLQIPPFGATPNTTIPVEQWAMSVTNDNQSTTSFVTEITSIADVLRQREGMYHLGNAMEQMFTQYASQCPMDADKTSICGGHGTCQIFPDSARCECLANAAGSSYVGSHCSCPGSTEAGPCYGHGTCDTGSDENGPGVCKCDKGFTGEACDIASCPTDPYFQAAGPCGKHGVCTAEGSCVCDQGWRGPACTVPCGDNGSNDLFQVPVIDGDTWGDLAVNTNIDLRYSNQDTDSSEPSLYEIWRGDFNVPGEVGFRPANARRNRALNSEDNYGWLIPMFYTTHSSSFPTPWNRNFQPPGDAICQMIFNSWLTDAYEQNQFQQQSGPPAITNMSVFSSRVQPPQIYDKAEGENHYSAMPSTSYIDTIGGNPYFANQGVSRSYPTYVHHFGWNHYPGSIYCYTQCPPSPANY